MMNVWTILCTSIHSECRIRIENKGRSEKAPALVHEENFQKIPKKLLTSEIKRAILKTVKEEIKHRRE